MNEIKIEKGIPIPSIRQGTEPVAGTIRQMEIGDSVFLAIETPAHRRHRQTIWATTAKQIGMKVRTRTVEGGLRIWRVS